MIGFTSETGRWFPLEQSAPGTAVSEVTTIAGNGHNPLLSGARPWLESDKARLDTGTNLFEGFPLVPSRDKRNGKKIG